MANHNRKTSGRRKAAPRQRAAGPSRAKRAGNTEYLDERVYRNLRERIMVGDFRPGDRLKEEHLCRVLAASRTTVRQALLRLTTEGLLISEPKRGKTVAAFTEETLAKLLPIRIVLEQLAVREAILNLDDHDAEELRALAARMRRDDIDLLEQDAMEAALHRKIWAIARNDVLEELLNRVVGPFHLMATAAYISPMFRRNWPVISLQQKLFETEGSPHGHQLLVDAICRRDVKAATHAIEEHLDFSDATVQTDLAGRLGKLVRKYWHASAR